MAIFKTTKTTTYKIEKINTLEYSHSLIYSAATTVLRNMRNKVGKRSLTGRRSEFRIPPRKDLFLGRSYTHRTTHYTDREQENLGPSGINNVHISHPFTVKTIKQLTKTI